MQSLRKPESPGRQDARLARLEETTIVYIVFKRLYLSTV